MSSSEGTCGLSATSRRPATTAAAGIASRTSASIGRGCDRHVPRPSDALGTRHAGHVRQGRQGGLDARGQVLSVVLVELDLDDRLVLHEARRQFLDGPLPDEPARGEDADPVAHRLDLREQVARQEDRQAVVTAERLEQLEDLLDADRVDRGRRLVEDEDVGVLDERIGNPEPLAHAARVRPDLVVAAIHQADLAEDLVDCLLRGLAVQPVEVRGVTQVRATRHVVVEPDGVGQVADPAFDFARVARRVEPDDTGLTLGRFGQPEEHQDRGRLAGAVLPEQPEDFAAAHLEVEAVDRGELAVLLGQTPRDQRRGWRRVRRRRGPGLWRRSRGHRRPYRRKT